MALGRSTHCSPRFLQATPTCTLDAPSPSCSGEVCFFCQAQNLSHPEAQCPWPQADPLQGGQCTDGALGAAGAHVVDARTLPCLQPAVLVRERKGRGPRCRETDQHQRTPCSVESLGFTHAARPTASPSALSSSNRDLS